MVKTDITPAFSDIFSIQKNKRGHHLGDPSRPGLIEHIVPAQSEIMYQQVRPILKWEPDPLTVRSKVR
jgi:hypothetical protein